MILQHTLGKALIDHVLPALADTVRAASEAVANADGYKADIFEVEEMQQQLMFALADFLLLSQCDHSEDHIHAPLRPHQLQDIHYARVFFSVEEAS